MHLCNLYYDLDFYNLYLLLILSAKNEILEPNGAKVSCHMTVPCRC